MVKYALEEKKGRKWKRVGGLMDTNTRKGKFALGIARALLKRTSAGYKKRNRLRKIE